MLSRLSERGLADTTSGERSLVDKYIVDRSTVIVIIPFKLRKLRYGCRLRYLPLFHSRFAMYSYSAQRCSTSTWASAANSFAAAGLLKLSILKRFSMAVYSLTGIFGGRESSDNGFSPFA